MLDLTPADTGCYIDGHWGQYGASRLLRIADDILGADFYEQALRSAPEECQPHNSCVDEIGGCEEVSWVADDAEAALNDATPDGLVWHWHDGEFFLSTICDDEETCDDETCAHWT
jgi:hypothetical protein